MEVLSKKCIQEIHSDTRRALQTKTCPKSTKETREKQVIIVPNFFKSTQPTSLMLLLLSKL